MDRLDRQGDLFLDWASVAFGDGERRGSGELPKDSSSFAGRSMSTRAAGSLPLPGWKGGNGRGGSRSCSPRPASTEFAGAHFLPSTGSPVRAIRRSVEPAPPILLPSLGAKGGAGLQGPGSLDC